MLRGAPPPPTTRLCCVKPIHEPGTALPHAQSTESAHYATCDTRLAPHRPVSPHPPRLTLIRCTTDLPGTIRRSAPASSISFGRARSGGGGKTRLAEVTWALWETPFSRNSGTARASIPPFIGPASGAGYARYTATLLVVGYSGRGCVCICASVRADFFPRPALRCVSRVMELGRACIDHRSRTPHHLHSLAAGGASPGLFSSHARPRLGAALHSHRPFANHPSTIRQCRVGHASTSCVPMRPPVRLFVCPSQHRGQPHASPQLREPRHCAALC